MPKTRKSEHKSKGERTSEEISRVATHVLRTKGPMHITYRAIADQMGVQPSLLVYHFGQKERLLEAAFDTVILDIQRYLSDIETALNEHKPDKADTTDYISAFLEDLIITNRWVSVAFFDLSSQALIDDTYRRKVRKVSGMLMNTISTLAADRVTDLDELAVLVHYIIGEVLRSIAWAHSVYDLAPLRSRVRHLLHSFEQQSHLAEFLQSLMSLKIPKTAKSTEVGGAAKPSSTLIVEAAIELIAENGLEGLNHRAIANRANVSLSSTTYHFATKQEIIEAAYEAILQASKDYYSSHVDINAAEDAYEYGIEAMLRYHLGEGRLNTIANTRLVVDGCRTSGVLDFAHEASRREFQAAQRMAHHSGDSHPDKEVSVVLAFVTGLTLERLVFSKARG